MKLIMSNFVDLGQKDVVRWGRRPVRAEAHSIHQLRR